MLPDYLELISPDEVMPGSSRLRTTHKDPLYFVCNINDRVNVFKNSFFHRAHALWNSLPLSIRLIRETDLFDESIKEHFMAVVDLEPD